MGSRVPAPPVPRLASVAASRSGRSYPPNLRRRGRHEAAANHITHPPPTTVEEAKVEQK